MKTNKVIKSAAFAMIAALSAFVMSCDDENRLTLQDAQDVSEDALTDSYFEDADDMSGIALQSDAATTGEGTAAGRMITISDPRFNCAGVVVTIESSPNSTPQNPMGVITIDFGAGCTDLRGNVRSGKLIITYSGRRFQLGSTVVLTTEEYFINGIQLEGTRTLTNITGSTEDAPKFSIVLEDGKATFPDGTTTLREASFTREWIRASSPTDDQLRVEGSANGTTRRGRGYTMEIIETLVFKRNCGLPVSGVKVFTVDGKEITVDYGDGECDRIVTYTVGDRTRSTTVGNN